MMYRIFFENRTLLISSKITDNISNRTYYYKNLDELKSFISDFEADKDCDLAVVWHEDVELLFEQCQKCFRIISAAGGAVLNEDGQLLVMKRRGMWDLPKGKIDAGESEKEAAVREVAEECGISNITLGKLRVITYHTYKYKANLILKPTYWFDMTTTKSQELIPQTEEDIEEVCWLDKKNIPSLYPNTYKSIIEVLESLI